MPGRVPAQCGVQRPVQHVLREHVHGCDLVAREACEKPKTERKRGVKIERRAHCALTKAKSTPKHERPHTSDTLERVPEDGEESGDAGREGVFDGPWGSGPCASSSSATPYACLQPAASAALLGAPAAPAMKESAVSSGERGTSAKPACAGPRRE